MSKPANVTTEPEPSEPTKLQSAFQTVESEASETLQFEELYRQNFNLVKGYFLRRRVSVEEADELTQEVFLNAFRGRKRFRGEAQGTTWLLVISHNLFANYVRARRTAKRDAAEVSLEAMRNQGETPPDLHTSDPSALEEALEVEKRAALGRAVRELPQRVGQIMRLAFVHGLKYRDIADLLEISVNTVKSSVFQGKAKLRDSIQETAPDLRLDLGEEENES
jgi:RNA polymerase sigma-70 factor (ECF subfamily)